MPPKRKAEAVAAEDLDEDHHSTGTAPSEHASGSGLAKKARVTDPSAESSTQAVTPKTWRDITLEGEEEVWLLRYHPR